MGRATQYACGDFDSSGPPGCLQYYTQTAATVQNFGYPTTTTTVTSSTTHLSNQKYDICIRRASGYCYICYSPSIVNEPNTATSHHKFCGRFLSTITDDLNSLTVCTRRSPFTIGVNLDSNEATGATIADEMADDIESGEIPGGIIGFSLTYFQVAC